MSGSADDTLRLLRTSTHGPGGIGAVLCNAAAGVEATVAWFEPRYWIARGAAQGALPGRGASCCVITVAAGWWRA
jgi:hypothetical protein